MIESYFYDFDSIVKMIQLFGGEIIWLSDID